MNLRWLPDARLEAPCPGARPVQCRGLHRSQSFREARSSGDHVAAFQTDGHYSVRSAPEQAVEVGATSRPRPSKSEAGTVT